MSDIPTMDVNATVELTAEHRIWTDRRLTIVLLVILLTVVGFEAARFTNGIHTRHKIDTSAVILRTVSRDDKIIKAATSPEAQARGAAAYAEAIGSIQASTQQIASVAIYCARFGGDVPTISACVDDQLKTLQSSP